MSTFSDIVVIVVTGVAFGKLDIRCMVEVVVAGAKAGVKVEPSMLAMETLYITFSVYTVLLADFRNCSSDDCIRVDCSSLV